MIIKALRINLTARQNTCRESVLKGEQIGGSRYDSLFNRCNVCVVNRFSDTLPRGAIYLCEESTYVSTRCVWMYLCLPLARLAPPGKTNLVMRRISPQDFLRGPQGAFP